MSLWRWKSRSRDVPLRLAAALVGVLFVGATPSSLRAAYSDFPKLPGLEVQVEFWKKIFATYSENQAVLHDAEDLGKVYSVVDLPGDEDGSGDPATLRRRRELVDAEKRRLSRILTKAAEGRLRMQLGLRERFKRGIEVSRRYLPHMEEIFRREGVPVELTRLPLIESTFNLKAYSKAAAAGIWQFIPASARIYGLRMNGTVDDRRDPLYATVAAARHLRTDYEVLGHWPLAITAYNHGRGGVARGVRETGSTNLVTIIRNYDGRSFGFASRNFYAEFVAALEIERHHKKYFPDLDYEDELEFEEVSVGDFVRFSTLAETVGCSEDELQELNPAFHAEVLEGRLYVPRGHLLRVPAGRSAPFRKQYAKLSSGVRFDSQRQLYLTHRVSRGQTLGAIARRYGTSVAAIQSINGVRRANRLRSGQLLRIPSKDGGVAQASLKAGSKPIAVAAGRSKTKSAVAAADPEPETKVAVAAAQPISRAAAPTEVYTTHRIARGQTLGSIAKRYGTTIEVIRSLNGIRNVKALQPGKSLRIPVRGGNGVARVTSGSGEAAFVKHRVSRGQTLGAIARRYRTSIRAIQSVNGLRSTHRLSIGQVLKIPSPS